MGKHIFRQKSMDAVTSPEQLNDYLRVTSPGVWAVLTAVLALLTGVCVWGIFGRLETVIPAVAVSANGRTVCYVAESRYGDVETGMTVRIDGEEFLIRSVAEQPEEASARVKAFTGSNGNLLPGEWVYGIELDGTAADGIHEAEIVTEQVMPASFLWN